MREIIEGQAELKRWPLLSLLTEDFVDRIESCIVFGNAGCAALIHTKDDQLYSIGSNSCTCLGSASTASFEPVRLEAMCGRGIKQMTYGAGPHVLALTDSGEVFAWGHNSHGQLGLGHTCCSKTPSLVLGALSGKRVSAVACGAYHSAALTENGELYTWGLNSSGQLGDSIELLNVKVYAWGQNEHGQIGTGNEVNQLSPFLVDSLTKKAVITLIAAGYAHSLALSDEGCLYVWGSNACGQLGNYPLRKKILEPMQTTKEIGGIVDIAAAHPCNITVVANQAGKVFMWGNVRGQSVTTPVETRFARVDDVFACFASPPVSSRILIFNEKRQTPLLDVLRAAFDDPTTADLKLIVEGRTIHVHKALLKMRCQYFRSRLGQMWPEASGSEITITGFTYATYRAFLQWLYTDELHVETDEALALMELANCYCEMELKRRCASIVSRTTSVENAAEQFAAALRHDVPGLEEHAFHFCLMHMTSVTLSEAFGRLDEASLKSLLTRAARQGVFKR